MSGNSMVSVFIFGQLPGLHKTRTLAVFAVSLRDARAYVDGWHRGAKLIRTIKSNGGQVHVGATMGGVTTAAQKLLFPESE